MSIFGKKACAPPEDEWRIVEFEGHLFVVGKHGAMSNPFGNNEMGRSAAEWLCNDLNRDDRLREAIKKGDV